MSKYVPENKFLLKKNKIEIDGDKNLAYDLSLIVKQQPNFKSLGLRINLWAYNQIDSAKVAKKRLRKNKKLSLKNQKRREKQARINKNRIAKAKRKDREYYTEKIIPLKDTINPRSFFREWLKYKIGEPPVVFDSSYMKKTIKQFNIYLKKKGFYFANTKAKVSYNKEAIVRYIINTGEVYIIDSLVISSKNKGIKAKVIGLLNSIENKEKSNALIGRPFDLFYLDKLRTKIAKNLRDSGFFGFTVNSISYAVDTNQRQMNVMINLIIEDSYEIRNGDNIQKEKYKVYSISEVNFKLCDSSYVKIPFKEYLRNKINTDSIRDIDEKQFIKTINTYRYAKLPFDVKERKRKNLSKEILDPKRKINVYYNGLKTSIRPEILELQNFLEETNIYKEYYVERSYNSLIRLGVFNNIRPVLKKNKNKDSLIVNYYLTPAKKQVFSFEPRFKNSNGLLGVTASLNYSNKNIFRGGEKLTISFGGGFESQPAVFDSTISTFNTIEIGPSISLELPGLFPTPATYLSKRQKPKTIIGVAYNIQKRNEFDREVFQLNYNWEFMEGKYQIIRFGLPFASVIKFIDFKRDSIFQDKINALNDPFLSNTYSKQLIWQDLRIGYEMNSQNKEEKKRRIHDPIYFSTNIDLAGNTPWFFRKNQSINSSTNQYEVFGIGYSQFFRINNDFIYSHKINPKNSLHTRVQAGIGLPYGNSETSLPYDYSFFAGGSNDNRGWRARSLGPGAYKYYLDSNSTVTQIGDIHLGFSFEYRFKISKVIQSALFIDAGNIWTNKEDNNRPNGEFSKNWFKQVAFATGTGLRLDLEYFIIRIDVGFPLYNPALPNKSRWVFQSRDAYYLEGMEYFNYDNINEAKSNMQKPFLPKFHFGLGFPF